MPKTKSKPKSKLVPPKKPTTGKPKPKPAKPKPRITQANAPHSILTVDSLLAGVDVAKHARSAIRPEVVADYASQLEADPTFNFPPVQVVSLVTDPDAPADLGTLYHLADGQHRLQAYRRAGRVSIPAIVIRAADGEEAHDEANRIAAKANIGHGVRRTAEDLAALLEWVLTRDDTQTWSDRNVADYIGCRSHNTVRAHRERLTIAGKLTGKASASARYKDWQLAPAAAPEPETAPASASGQAAPSVVLADPIAGMGWREQRIEHLEYLAEEHRETLIRQGYQVAGDVENAIRMGLLEGVIPDPVVCRLVEHFAACDDAIEWNKPQAQPASESTPDAPRPVPGQETGERTVATVRTGGDAPKDHVGEAIPEHLRHVWNDAKQAMRGLQGRVSAIVDDAIALSAKPIGAGLHSHSVQATATDLIKSFSDAAPYAVCPVCVASGKHCDVCHGRGWLTRPGYDQIPASYKPSKKGAKS